MKHQGLVRSMALGLAACAVLAGGGCVYLQDRGRDFADIFGLDVGSGAGIGVDLQLSIYIHAGIAVYDLEKYVLTPNEIDRWREVVVAPVIGRMIFYYDKSQRTSIRPRREGRVPDAVRGGLLISPPIVGELLETEQIRATGFEEPARNPEAPWINALDTDVGVALAVVGFRFGISPGELIDFLLGWFGFDIGFDDTRTIKRLKKQREFVRAFFAAVRDGDAAVVKEMLKRDPALASRPEEAEGRWRPLHYAARKGRKEIAELLIRRNAELDAKTRARLTPLHVAARHGHLNVAQLLVFYGASVHARDVVGYAPLHYTGYGHVRKKPAPGHVEVAKFLLSRRANVNVRGNDRKTPLSLAIASGHRDLADLLRKHGGTK